MYYTYVLESEKDGKKYTGYTRNLKLRFKQHKEGKVESTRHRTPLKLIYYEACLSEEDAINREKYLKTHYGGCISGKGLNLILRGGHHNPSLSFTL
jgi:putative endonuclease